MELPLKGTIKDQSLVKVLVYLNRHRKTGALSLSTSSFTKKIYLQDGDAIFASSTYEDDRLGEMLLKANKITVEQYDKSVEVLKATRKRQGAILVELGYITPKDLFWGVKYQVKEIILSMFQITDAVYEFSEAPIPHHEVITLRMSMGNLICEGVRKIDNWTRIRNEMPDTDSVLVLSSDPLSLFQDVELSPQDKKVLSLIDGRSTIGEVIENSWMGSFEALKILYVFWSLGIVELKDAAAGQPKEDAAFAAREEPVPFGEILQPPSEEDEIFLQKVDALYSRLPGISSRELLEVDGEADGETIRRNYYRLARDFHPDRNFNSTDESVKSKLTAIFDAVTAAYNALKEEPAQEVALDPLEEAVEAVDNEKEADGRFKAGVAEFKKGNIQGAVDHFRQAAELMPEISRYWNYLSLGYSRLPGKLKEAGDALAQAIRIEPMNADFYSNMGLICLKAGQKEKAHASFEEALRIDPSNEKARKGLRQSGGR
jgi:tetratricopeptide (TPR) repeat protein